MDKLTSFRYAQRIRWISIAVGILLLLGSQLPILPLVKGILFILAAIFIMGLLFGCSLTINVRTVAIHYHLAKAFRSIARHAVKNYAAGSFLIRTGQKRPVLSTT